MPRRRRGKNKQKPRNRHAPKGKGYIYGTCVPLEEDVSFTPLDDDELGDWWQPPPPTDRD